MRGVASGFLLILVVFILAVLTFNAQHVGASETIYVRADGSIDPPTANITSIDNITYTLTGNICNGIVIQKSDVTIDGTGHVIQGSQGGVGIYFEDISGVAIKNLTIKGFEYSIKISTSPYNTIKKCNVTDKMKLSGSRNNVTQCRLESGLDIVDSGFNNIYSNYIEDGILLSSSGANNISGNRIAYGDCGIEGIRSSNNIIRWNQIFCCQVGINFHPLSPPPRGMDLTSVKIISL